MTYLSLFSGIEAATAAWHPLGWRPVGFSEIEKFPCAVLKHHYPDVPNYGDVTKHKEWDIEKPVDLIVGGSPCQSFSVAGLRKGLDDPRGNLTLEFLSVVAKVNPRWVVWENVPGVLSDKSNAFGQFLSGLSEIGYSCAYRILDAQYFGVPQRRRRVFVVGYIGDWRPPAAVLFEPESLQGDITPRREAGQDVAGGFEIGPSGNRRCDVTPTLDARCKDGPIRNQIGTLVMAHGDIGTYSGEDVAPTIISRMASGTGNTQDAQVIATHEVPIVFKATMSATSPVQSETCPTLEAENNHAIAFTQSRDETVKLINHTSSTLDAVRGIHDKTFISNDMTVRRLTPMECERLQGFPDKYTRIPYRSNARRICADAPRYKALGNSMAVPVMRWIGERIDMWNKPIDKGADNAQGRQG